MKNIFLKNLIEAEVISLRNFNLTCETMAKKDDGIIDKEEDKQLKKIRRATENYIKILNKISR